jgi:hypothetical protein
MKTIAIHRCFAVLAVAICAGMAGTAWGREVMDVGPGQRDGSGPFHRAFDGGQVTPRDRLVLLVSVTGGAVVSVNGHEVGRVNLPAGPVDAKAVAEPVSPKDKGMFYRFRLPADVVKAGPNEIDADVHPAEGDAGPAECQLEVKTLPTLLEQPPVDDAAKRVLELFRHTSYLPAGMAIPDGYIDGGHGMRLDAADQARSSREILVVDRPADPELQVNLTYARTLVGLPPMERAHKLSLYVDALYTPPAGRAVLGDTVTQIQDEFKNQPLCIGDVVDQCHAGVCRHRSLLFKLLADEAGLKTALVRGNYFHAGKGDPHAWNEIVMTDGRRYLVDVTQHPNDEFWEITSPAVTPATVVKHYVKLDNTPYYGAVNG